MSEHATVYSQRLGPIRDDQWQRALSRFNLELAQISMYRGNGNAALHCQSHGLSQPHFRSVDPEHARVAAGSTQTHCDGRPWNEPQFHQAPSFLLRQVEAVQDALLAAPEGLPLVFLAPRQATFQLEYLCYFSRIANICYNWGGSVSRIEADRL